MQRALRRGWMAGLVIAVGLVVALAGCGGDESDDGTTAPAGGPDAPPALHSTATPWPPAPRLKLLPEGDPRDFEAPFSVGMYIRQTVHGQPAATRTGGQRATYRVEDQTASLSVYHFERPEEAIDAVRFALENATIDALLGEPYFSPTVAYGEARDRHGNHLAAWSHEEWYYLVRITGGPEDLAAFMEVFPY